MDALQKMFEGQLELTYPMSRNLDWLETEARDAFQQADEGKRDEALGRLTVIVGDLILMDRHRIRTGDSSGS